jgi:AraC-like DNA-binding protein
MTDRLEALFKHFGLSAELFNTGRVCGVVDVDEPDVGHLHVIRSGSLDVHHAGRRVLEIREPTLLLYPRPMAHRFVGDVATGADLTCARLRFQGGAAHPIAEALPAHIALPLSSLGWTAPLLEALFHEAEHDYCGRRVVLDRLFEVLFVQVLRTLMHEGHVRAGLMAGLAHPKLRLALVAMHEQPARDWSLEMLAQQAGMSRSAFAEAFRAEVGETAGAYLQRWRIALVQRALREGRGLKQIAIDVGYGSEAALSRAFKSQLGVSPREWRAGSR